MRGRELQELLVGHGFSTGGVDGIVGRETRAAMRAYQKRRGLAPDGYPGSKLLGSLRVEVRR